jgi:hypothetical protein
MVLISGAGKTTVVFLSTPISTRLCRLLSCKASGCAIIVSDASPSAAAASASPSAAMIFARFARSASAWRANAFHAIRKLGVPQLDERNDDAPFRGRDVKDLTYVDVDTVGLGQRLIQRVLADNLTPTSFVRSG